MAPTKSTTAKATPSEAPPAEVQDDSAEVAERQEDAEPELQKTSTRPLDFGDHLWYRGDSGPAVALVTAGAGGEAEVLILRPDEVPRGRSVSVYDSAEDAERGFQEGRAHVAWHR